MGRRSRPIDSKVAEAIAAYSAGAPASLSNPTPAELIRHLRHDLGLTQAQLASRAGLPQAHLARIETGKVDPRVGTLRRILSAVGRDLLLVPKPTSAGSLVGEREQLEERLAQFRRMNEWEAAQPPPGADEAFEQAGALLLFFTRLHGTPPDDPEARAEEVRRRRRCLGKIR